MLVIASQLILASGSPRRKELLEQVGLSPFCCPVNVDETPEPGDLPTDLVRRLAASKATGCDHAQIPPTLVLGADTVIDLDGEVLGKPVDCDDCVRMLCRLANRRHAVTTGVCVVGSAGEGPTILSVSTHVQFGSITPEQALSYWRSGEPVDKAGGYAIQGLGAQFVAHIAGSYSNVVGLPLYETLQLLQHADNGLRQ